MTIHASQVVLQHATITMYVLGSFLAEQLTLTTQISVDRTLSGNTVYGLGEEHLQYPVPSIMYKCQNAPCISH